MQTSMFCERCGRLLNRATGRCVCDDDPSLRVPVAVGAAVGAPTTESSGLAPIDAGVAPSAPAVPPGWYQDPENPACRRWWDGYQWTSDVAPLEPVAPGVSQAPAQSWIAAIPRVRMQRRDYDLFFFDDRVVAVRLKSAHAVSIGVVLGGVLGQLMGQKVEGSRSRDRLAALRFESPDALASSARSIVIPMQDVSTVNAHAITGGGKIVIETSRAKYRARWTRGYVDDDQVEFALHRAFGSRLRWRRRSAGSRVLAVIGMALVALFVLSTSVSLVVGAL